MKSSSLQFDIFIRFWDPLRTLLTGRSFCPKSHFIKIFDCLQQFVRMSSRSRIPKMSPLSLGGSALHCILRRVLLPWHWIGFTIVISCTSLFFWLLFHARVCFSDCYFIHEFVFSNCYFIHEFVIFSESSIQEKDIFILNSFMSSLSTFSS